ncbi:MAG TPA: aldehyde dehydrogenase family protein, partial [Verrucomicrobiae bacterium]|nr:aldehyde dehydrogenase family protein [Verrucomicrobiae bacterium]
MSSPGLPARIPVLFRDEDDDIAAEIEVAMTSARSAQGRWSQVSLKRRLSLIRELRRLIAENASQLAEASARVRQRPIGESLTTEIVPLAEACRFLEREAGKILTPRRLGSRHRPVWLSGVTTEILREPIGVVLIIGPGNYPLLLPGVQLIQALAAGNAVLLKPGVDGTPA